MTPCLTRWAPLCADRTTVRGLIGFCCVLVFAAAATVAHAQSAAPAVSAITFHDSPARGDTYELGERVQVEVRFDRAVKATGRPQVALTIGTQTRHATFASRDGLSLYFDYTVQETDRDEDGIGIAANSLTLNGGTIKAADDMVEADLTHGAVAAAPGYKVDGSLISAPAVKRLSITSSPAKGDTYELGESVEVVVEFDRVVTPTGRPQLALTIGEETRHATAWGWGSHPSLSFQYTVQGADRDEDGISIAEDTVDLDGGAIKGPDGATDADLTHPAVAAEGGHKVDGSLVSRPAVKNISFVNSPARGDTYERGETVEALVWFDRTVTADGNARLALTIGTETRQATASGWGSSRALFFAYTVREADRDQDGISIPADALALDGGTIKGLDGTTDADLTHAAVAPDRGRKVDGSLDSPPAVKRVYFGSPLAGDDIYELGETVQVVVEFDKTVTVTGSPQVALTIGAETRYAAYFRSWGDDRHVPFSYTVQEGDRDEDGISIPANALSLNGGTIKAADGTTDAELTHGEVAPEHAVKVDGTRDVTRPRVRGISFVSSPARGDTYELGETIEVVVEFDATVQATGEPRLTLTIGTRTRHAALSGWSSHTLYFDYTVQVGDRDEDGISIPANALSLDGGTITAADGRTDAVLAHEAVGAAGFSKVNGSDVTPPRVSAVRFAYSPARGDTYELGETVEVEVEFNRAVEATGNPEVALAVGNETRHATFSGWGNQTLYFDYTVQVGDRDEDGISIPANALTLNGGTITAGDGTTDADLTHGPVAAEGGRKVNGSVITPPVVRHVYFVSFPARGDTYELGETIRVNVQFDKAVTVTGSPQVTLIIGTQTRQAAYSTWGDGRDLSFSYVVQADDRDEDGISIPANALTLNGGTITAVDGTTDADLTHVAAAAERDWKVDGGRDVAPPRVRDISFVSSPLRGGTYELGETVEVLVEFDGAVKVTGDAEVALTIGTQTRYAVSSGWSSDSLYFQYTVQEGDRDEDGISIPANALALSGGTITAVDGTTHADLTHEAVASEGGDRVDGGLVAPPRVRGIFFLSSPARGDTYQLGETVEVEVEFDRTVTVTGTPQVALTVGAQTRLAAYSMSWGDDRYAYFSYAVQEDDRDEDGISIAANALLLDGGTITATDGTTDAVLTHAAVASVRNGKVDGSGDITPPRVRALSFDSTPARGDTYALGETVEVVVEFDGAVETTGEPQVALTIGPLTRHATWFGSRNHSLLFRYTVQTGDRDEDGISITANAFALEGGTITAPDGMTDAVLTHAAVAAEPGHKVNGSDVTPPRVIDIYFPYSPARGDTYELGETIEVEVEFGTAVKVTGEPQVALTVGTETRYAALRGRGSQTLYFEYTVQEGDRDEDGISIAADALSLEGGTIMAADGTTAADLRHYAVAAQRGSKVNGGLVTPPGVRGTYLVSSPARDDTYELGETIEVLVEFDRAVTVTGSPQVALTIGTQTRQAVYSRSWDDRHAFFSYTVQAADRDEDGVSIAADALSFDGGTITAVDGTTDADPTHDAVPADSGSKVDGSGGTS